MNARGLNALDQKKGSSVSAYLQIKSSRCGAQTRKLRRFQKWGIAPVIGSALSVQFGIIDEVMAVMENGGAVDLLALHLCSEGPAKEVRKADWSLPKRVIPLGLEPKTVCLEGRCSIQLSYGTIATRCKDAKLKCIIFNQIA